MDYKTTLIHKDGHFGSFGGRYVPEVLVPIMDDLRDAFFEAVEDEAFVRALQKLHRTYTGRPTPLYHCENLSEKLGGAQIFMKNEGLLHTGAHKINHCVGQALIAKRMGKKRVIAETGAGQHGLATATVCAKFGLDCTVYIRANQKMVPGYSSRPMMWPMELEPSWIGSLMLRTA